MISKLSDEDALDLLMTSEFHENHSPKEFKSMLLKYRYFYRILFTRMERLKDDHESVVDKLSQRIEILENTIFQHQVRDVQSQELISSMKNRKLTWKERIKGKIILKEDEDKGI